MECRIPVLQYGPEPGETASEDSNSQCAWKQQLNSGDQAAKRSSVQKPPQSRDASNSSACKSGPPEHDVMQELSKERRRRAFIGMLKLLEHGAQDYQHLNRLVAPMSDEELLQVAEERSLAGKCGNPLCAKPFVWNEPRQKYRVSAQNIHKLEGDCYCSKSCGSFVRQMAAQLMNPMERIQPATLQQHLAQPSHRPKQGVAAQGGGVPTMRSLIKERDPFQLIHEAEEAGQQLDQAAGQRQGSADAAAAVEGFVPRAQPSRHHQQQQQRVLVASSGGSETNAEPLEVLPLNPVMSKTCKQAAAADIGSGPSKEQDKVYLHLHKAHQDQQLRQAHDVSSLTALEAVQVHEAAADAEGTQGSVDIHTLVQPKPSAPEQPNPGDSPQQPFRRRRTVTFAPTVEYSCPSQPQQPPEQPVLTFTLLAPQSRQQPSSSSSAGLQGELKVSSADDSEDQQTSAEDGVAQQASLADSSAAAGAEPELYELWRLFFPPALGGLGVPVKQLVKTNPMPRAGSQKQLPHQSGQHSQQRSTQAREPVVTKPQPVTALGAPAAAVVASGASRHDVSAAVQLRQVAVDSKLACDQQQKAAQDSKTTCQPSLTGQQLPEQQGITQGDRSTAASARRARKFTPIARPRRSIVVLDSVPGVTIRERGVPLRSSQGAANAPAGRQQQQRQQQHLSAGADPAAALGMSQPLDGGEPQQQPQHHCHHSKTVVCASVGQGSAVNIPDSSSSASSHNDAELSSFASDTLIGGGQQISRAASRAGHSSDAISPAPGQQHRHTGQGAQICSRSGSHHLERDSSDKDDGFSEDDTDAGSGIDGAVSDVSDSGFDELSADSSEEEAYGNDVNQQLQGALQSLLPFMDTDGVTVHLSEFGMLWNAMHAWISPETTAYVNNKQAAAAVVAAAIDAAVGGGKPAATAAACEGHEAEDGVAPPRFVLQQRTALANMLASALPAVVEQLVITAPQAELTRHLHALVRSFYMPGPLPPLQMHHWQVVVALMLAALSAWRIPSTRHCFGRQQPANSKLGCMLNHLGTDIDRFMALLDLFELDF